MHYSSGTDINIIDYQSFLLHGTFVIGNYEVGFHDRYDAIILVVSVLVIVALLACESETGGFKLLRWS